MRKRILAVGFVALLTMAALLSMPAQTEAGNCWYGYQYCSQNFCSPDDQQCQTGCECSYMSCLGMELPSYCIY
jgi:hypothetical protein